MINSQNWEQMTGDIFHIKSKHINLHQTAYSLKYAELCIVSQLRVDLQLLLTSNSQVSENREIVKTIFEALLYLARQNNAFRGHDEHWSSSNQGNFIELVKLLAKYNPLLSAHLYKIQSIKKNRITFYQILVIIIC